MNAAFLGESGKQESRKGNGVDHQCFLLSCFPDSSSFSIREPARFFALAGFCFSAFLSSAFAAINAAPSTPEPVEIKDIAPPVDVWPYPIWMTIVAAVLALALLGGLVWFVVALVKNRPAPPPLSATAVAIQALEKLRARIKEIAPYDFSIAVSNVLRTFISNAKFRLPATKQTSPEFLAAISGSPNFTDADRTLLAGFLEHCDMIKFARIDATADDSAKLLESAIAFVQGGRA